MKIALAVRDVAVGTAAILALGVMPSVGLAQAAPPNTPIARRAEPAYRLRPEDIIRIQVFGQPQIGADVPVSRDGTISAPFAGTIRAEGKTTGELERDLYKLYVDNLKLRNPIVSVTITRFRDLRATVNGFVQRPGQYSVRPGDTIITILSQGGGPIPDRADLRRATLRKANTNELIPIDLFAMLTRGDTSQNYEIEDGDELTVPEETQNRILVLGAVQRPGYYNYKEPMALADAIALAGGEINYRTKFSGTMVFRKKNGDDQTLIRIKANFVDYVKKGDLSQNVVLHPGDMIYIPQTNTPNFNQINAIVNTFFVINTFGGIFGLRLFR